MANLITWSLLGMQHQHAWYKVKIKGKKEFKEYWQSGLDVFFVCFFFLELAVPLTTEEKRIYTGWIAKQNTGLCFY